MIQLTINGKPYSLPPLAGEMLSSLLRERLHLTGTTAHATSRMVSPAGEPRALYGRILNTQFWFL